jgi:choline dehydrogenase-like flavoprotein
MERPNLTVALHTTVDRVLLEGGRAVGVQGRQNGQAFEAQATREVILATGAIVTPKILQLSGIGPADTLRSVGVDVVVDSPNVGGRLREHRAFRLQFRLAEDLGYNKILGTQTGQEAAADRSHVLRSTSSGSSRPAQNSTAPTRSFSWPCSRSSSSNPPSRSNSRRSRA